MRSTTTIIRRSIAKAHGLPVQAARNENIANASGEKMKMISQVVLTINHRGKTIKALGLVAEKLCHEMLISWKDCIRLEVIPKSFPMPPETGHVNEIQSKADTIKEMITNKYDIIRDYSCHNNGANKGKTHRYKDYTIQGIHNKTNSDTVSRSSRCIHQEADRPRHHHKSYKAHPMVLTIP